MRIISVLKYGIVGLTGMIIDFSITYIFKEKLRVNKYFSNSIGFSCAVFSNFICNKYWTFNDNSQKTSEQFILFLFIALAGLLINNLIIHWLTKKRKINFYLAKISAVLIVFIWNYSLNLFITFR